MADAAWLNQKLCRQYGQVPSGIASIACFKAISPSFFMSILDLLTNKETWSTFLEYKTTKNQLNKKEQKELTTFINEQKYSFYNDEYLFSYPLKKEISKIGSTKKRTVYSYKKEEMWILKLLTFILYKYDDKLVDNSYAFRKKLSARDAIRKISAIKNRYTLKLDIHDYFNSISSDILIKILKENILDDDKLLIFLTVLLKQDKSIFNNQIISEQRGAMAGIPLASFFANFYLKDIDEYFYKQNIDYFRYSDDILIIADDKDKINNYYSYLVNALKEKQLSLNEKKTKFTNPNEAFEYLGFEFSNDGIDLAKISIEKMKGKIKRKAHNLYRKRKRNNKDFTKTATSMIKSFDNKFYDLSGDNRFTWTRWYFPIITKTNGLKEIDRYFVLYLRYLATGRHNKSNFSISYDSLKKLGYTSLVHEYYQWKKDNNELAN